jgi:hypothetical protein
MGRARICLLLDASAELQDRVGSQLPDLQSGPWRQTGLTGYDAIVRLFPQDQSAVERAAQAAQMKMLAVKLAPARINGVIAGAPDFTARTVEWLFQAEAVTGQIIAAAPDNDLKARS